jgi:hypothetical protein
MSPGRAIGPCSSPSLLAVSLSNVRVAATVLAMGMRLAHSETAVSRSTRRHSFDLWLRRKDSFLTSSLSMFLTCNESGIMFNICVQWRPPSPSERSILAKLLARSEIQGKSIANSVITLRCVTAASSWHQIEKKNDVRNIKVHLKSLSRYIGCWKCKIQKVLIFGSSPWIGPGNPSCPVANQLPLGVRTRVFQALRDDLYRSICSYRKLLGGISIGAKPHQDDGSDTGSVKLAG